MLRPRFGPKQSAPRFAAVSMAWPQPDGQLGGGHHLGVCAAQGADDGGRPSVRGWGGQRMPLQAPGTDRGPREARYICRTVGHRIALVAWLSTIDEYSTVRRAATQGCRGLAAESWVISARRGRGTDLRPDHD